MPQLSPIHLLAARVCYITIGIIAALGAISNFSLLLVTIRTKSPRSTCHFLIGLCALLDGLHQIGPLMLTPLLVLDVPMNNLACTAIMALPEVGLLCGTACVLCIGMERLTAIVFMAFYKRVTRIKHLAVYLISLACFAAYGGYLMTVYFEPGVQMCSINTPYHGEAALLFVRTLGTINLLTLLVYSITAIAIRQKTGVSPSLRRAFNCLFIIVIFDVGGWAISVFSLTIVFALDVTVETRGILIYAAGIFVNVGIASKALIYYSVSDEYRHAFRSVFGNMLRNVRLFVNSGASEITTTTF